MTCVRLCPCRIWILSIKNVPRHWRLASNSTATSTALVPACWFAVSYGALSPWPSYLQLYPYGHTGCNVELVVLVLAFSELSST